MDCRYLVVGFVGDNRTLRRRLARKCLDKAGVNAVAGEPRTIAREVVADGAKNDGLFAQKRKVVRNIPRRPAEILFERVYHKAHREIMRGAREDIIPKPPGEIHNPVIYERTRYENFHLVHRSSSDPVKRRHKVYFSESSSSQEINADLLSTICSFGFKLSAVVRIILVIMPSPSIILFIFFKYLSVF